MEKQKDKKNGKKATKVKVEGVKRERTTALNSKELRVHEALKRAKTATLRELTRASFSGHSPGTSWARNSLRKLCRLGYAKQVARGTYVLGDGEPSGQKRWPAKNGKADAKPAKEKPAKKPSGTPSVAKPKALAKPAQGKPFSSRLAKLHERVAVVKQANGALPSL